MVRVLPLIAGVAEAVAGVGLELFAVVADGEAALGLTFHR
jgi:hypothetical protein